MPPLQRIKPIDIPTMHEELQDRLKEYILANKLKVGDPLPTEAQLADQLGISRAVVREGLRSLESLGLIYSRRGEGRYVRGFNLDPILKNLHYNLLFDTEDVREMIEICERLETGFIGDAIAAMDPAKLTELRSLVADMRQKSLAGEDFLDRDLEFHAAIYRAVNNHVLSKLLGVFHTVDRNVRDRSLRVTRNAAAEVDMHEEILNAIEWRKTDLAQQLIRDYFTGIKQRLSAAQTAFSTADPTV